MKREEAAEVLRRLLKARANLANEAEGIAKAVLTQVNFVDSAVGPFIEDIKRQIDLGLDAEALETCKGVMPLPSR